jgi:hypothetical protein
MTMLWEESEFSHALVLAERIFNRIKYQKKNLFQVPKSRYINPLQGYLYQVIIM